MEQLDIRQLIGEATAYNKNPCIPLRDYDVEKEGQMVAHTALKDGTSEGTSGGAFGGEEPTLESSLGQS